MKYFRTLVRLLCSIFILLLGAFAPHLEGASPLPAKSRGLLIEAEQFESHGGWVLDQQFMDQMGSPYLLAHGLGEPVADASTSATFPAPGSYRAWVRTRDWVAPWKVGGAPGKFQVLIDGTPLRTTFGTEGENWHWQDGGNVQVGKRVRIALHDLTGFEGRCDAIIFCRDPAFEPPNDLKSLTILRQRFLALTPKPKPAGQFDLVVVGGGIAGTCAALSAARLGLSVALVQDRPVLGGNNSSEVRVWLNGLVNLPPYERVGDIVSELEPTARAHYGAQNTAELYEDQKRLELAHNEPNLRLFLNHRVNELLRADGKHQATNGHSRRITAVVAQDTRTGNRVQIRGRWFADCTGDGVVGFLAGAEFEMTEKQHMGPSNLWNVEDSGKPKTFPACACDDTNALSIGFEDTRSASRFPRCPWAVDLRDKPFPGRGETAKGKDPLERLGGWYWESGFDRDSIQDVELMRDLNLRAMYGAWDTLKNVDRLYPNHRLKWAAYIAGKRESRRLLGDVVLTAEDIKSGREFEDGCFPCTWPIDLHTPHPKYRGGHDGNEFISTCTGGPAYSYKKPYWAPYRCLYSRNVNNLFMAGRDISVTHEALGAVRVMRTGGAMGEIVGMAASICKQRDCSPREVYEKHMDALKSLMKTGVGSKKLRIDG